MNIILSLNNIIMSCNSCSSCNAYTIINHHVKRAVNVCGNNRPCILSSLCYQNCTILPYSGVISEYSYTFTNFILPSSYTRIHFYLYGPGASVYTNTTTYNGGGSGAFMSLNIPYSFKDSTICEIYCSTGFSESNSAAGSYPSTVVITYTDSSQITLSAGNGAGQNGGIANITNSSNIPLGAVISINGKNGGSQNESGESSTLTVSGSGRNGTSLSPVSNVAPAINSIILPTSATTQTTVNIYSSGGGKTSSSSAGAPPPPIATNGGFTTFNYIGGGGGSAGNGYTYTSNGTNFNAGNIDSGGNGLILFGVTK